MHRMIDVNRLSATAAPSSATRDRSRKPGCTSPSVLRRLLQSRVNVCGDPHATRILAAPMRFAEIGIVAPLLRRLRALPSDATLRRGCRRAPDPSAWQDRAVRNRATSPGRRIFVRAGGDSSPCRRATLFSSCASVSIASTISWKREDGEDRDEVGERFVKCGPGRATTA